MFSQFISDIGTLWAKYGNVYLRGMKNTLLLADALQDAGWQFELMIYPDGMHGYRGSQHDHDAAADALFWTKHLLSR